MGRGSGAFRARERVCAASDARIEVTLGAGVPRVHSTAMPKEIVLAQVHAAQCILAHVRGIRASGSSTATAFPAGSPLAGLGSAGRAYLDIGPGNRVEQARNQLAANGVPFFDAWELAKGAVEAWESLPPERLELFRRLYERRYEPRWVRDLWDAGDRTLAADGTLIPAHHHSGETTVRVCDYEFAPTMAALNQVAILRRDFLPTPPGEPPSLLQRALDGLTLRDQPPRPEAGRDPVPDAKRRAELSAARRDLLAAAQKALARIEATLPYVPAGTTRRVWLKIVSERCRVVPGVKDLRERAVGEWDALCDRIDERRRERIVWLAARGEVGSLTDADLAKCIEELSRYAYAERTAFWLRHQEWLSEARRLRDVHTERLAVLTQRTLPGLVAELDELRAHLQRHVSST